MFLSLKKETEEIIKIIQNKGYYFFDFSLNEKLRDVLFIKKNKLNVVERYLCLFFTSRKIKEYLKNESNFLRNYILLFLSKLPQIKKLNEEKNYNICCNVGSQ